jgi:hypothetical protein
MDHGAEAAHVAQIKPMPLREVAVITTAIPWWHCPPAGAASSID